jgi:hypothetical protein
MDRILCSEDFIVRGWEEGEWLTRRVIVTR